jgi:hypothetical protein
MRSAAADGPLGQTADARVELRRRLAEAAAVARDLGLGSDELMRLVEELVAAEGDRDGV